MEDIARQECKEGMFRRRELLERFTARKLFRWSDKQYNQEYWGRLERNWRWWKVKQSGKKRMKMIAEKEKTKKQKIMTTKWTIWLTHTMNCRKISWDKKT